MKEMLFTSIRHALTALAGLGGLLAAKGLIDPAEAAAVDAAGVSAADALTVVLVAVIARLVIFLAGKWTGSGGSPTAVGCIAACMMVGSLVVTGTSCTPQQLDAARNIPVKVCYVDEAGNSVCYSSKEGLVGTVDKRSGK